MRGPGKVELLLRAVAPEGAAAARALGGGRRDILAHRQRAVSYTHLEPRPDGKSRRQGHHAGS